MFLHTTLKKYSHNVDALLVRLFGLIKRPTPNSIVGCDFYSRYQNQHKFYQKIILDRVFFVCA